VITTDTLFGELSLVQKEPDPRHAQIRKYINKVQRDSGDPEQWDGRSAKALSNWLKANPSVTLEQAVSFVENRFASAEPRGAPPWEWIPKLTKYSEGPLDKYGKTWQPDFRAGYEGMKAAKPGSQPSRKSAQGNGAAA